MNPPTNTEAGAVADVAGKLTDRAEVERVTKRLTVTMLKAILTTNPGQVRPYSEVNRQIRSRLFMVGLFERAPGEQPARCRLTPLGVAVRAHLSEQGATAGVVGAAAESANSQGADR
jgi:hypothetical protein